MSEESVARRGLNSLVDSLAGRDDCDHGSYAVLMFGERECLVCGHVELPAGDD